MPHRLPLIGFAYDAGYARVVETYRALLGSTAFAACPSAVAAFDPRHPQRFIVDLARQDVTLAHIGMPGKPGYDRQLHGFMDAYASARRKPVLGLVSHDDQQTRYVLEQWLSRVGAGSVMPHPPGDLITIVETRRPLSAEMLELALEALTAKRNALLSAPSRRAIPAPIVAVESLILWKDTPLRKLAPLKEGTHVP